MFQYFLHMGHEHDLQAVFDLSLNLFHIRLVLLRDEYLLDTRDLRGEEFSFRPPIGSTLPRSVISPVIATSARTGLSVIADSIAVAIVIPAEGPSFGTAPSGIWICISFSLKSRLRSYTLQPQNGYS